jgi:hypothetical protein
MRQERLHRRGRTGGARERLQRDRAEVGPMKPISAMFIAISGTNCHSVSGGTGASHLDAA